MMLFVSSSESVMEGIMWAMWTRVPPKAKWVLAVLAVVALIAGIGVYRWYAGRSLGEAGRQDGCAAVNINDDAGWIPVADSSPAGMKRLLAAQPLLVRGLTDSPTAGTPVLTHPIQMHTGQDFNDCPHWLLPEYDIAGHLVAMSDYVYYYPRQRVRFANSGQIFPGEPRYSNPFPYLSAAQAMALVKRARGVDVRPNPAPELVFLPIDVGLPEAPGLAANWRGGGVAPSDPVWLLAGSDGQDYIIGTDRHVYALSDVPLS
jgi:hypothetical protein